MHSADDEGDWVSTPKLSVEAETTRLASKVERAVQILLPLGATGSASDKALGRDSDSGGPDVAKQCIVSELTVSGMTNSELTVSRVTDSG